MNDLSNKKSISEPSIPSIGCLATSLAIFCIGIVMLYTHSRVKPDSENATLLFGGGFCCSFYGFCFTFFNFLKRYNARKAAKINLSQKPKAYGEHVSLSSISGAVILNPRMSSQKKFIVYSSRFYCSQLMMSKRCVRVRFSSLCQNLLCIVLIRQITKSGGLLKCTKRWKISQTRYWSIQSPCCPCLKRNKTSE